MTSRRLNSQNIRAIKRLVLGYADATPHTRGGVIGLGNKWLTFIQLYMIKPHLTSRFLKLLLLITITGVLAREPSFPWKLNFLHKSQLA